MEEAKNECNATEDCGGFYHYNVNGKDRVCFKKDVTVDSEKQKRVPPGHGGSSGFHVVHGEKPVINTNPDAETNPDADANGDGSSQVIRLNTGTCENPITTNEECIAAATALGLDPPMWILLLD